MEIKEPQKEILIPKEKTKCKWCGSSNLTFRLRPDTPHYAEAICRYCNKHCYWISNPNTKNKKNRARTGKNIIKEIYKFHELTKEICFFCLRDKKDLGENETLTHDHIQELNKGGEDKIQNMQVLCSACHKLKNWCRLYLNWHLNKEEENDSQTTSKS